MTMTPSSNASGRAKYFRKGVRRLHRGCNGLQAIMLTVTGGDPVESASLFYKGIKVYPQPLELMQIYEQTVPKPILDILAEMIAHDSTIGSVDD